MTAPTVLAIGSCRIFRPLRHLHVQGRIELLNPPEYQWFTHTAAAARQHLDLIQGRVTLPPELLEAALEHVLDVPENLRVPVAHPDVVVVEVSTLKQHYVGGVHVNAHKVYGIARAAVGDDYQPVMQGRTGGLPDGHPLKGMRMSYATRDEVAADLVAIRERLESPVMVVNHLHSLTPEGTPAPDRVKLTEELRAIAAAHGFPLYDTAEAILEHGVDTALEDQNHYRKEFEPVVAERLHAGVIQLLKASA